jgi:predicted nucleic acid-binding protein
MIELFVDTSGWASWADRSQIHHPSARDALDQVWARGGIAVTTNWVLVELTALMNRPLHIPRSEQIRFLGDLLDDPSVLVLSIDPSLELSSWTLWKSRSDKDWSMVDCASFVVMHQRGLADALTADRHFEQAGFRRLLG